MHTLQTMRSFQTGAQKIAAEKEQKFNTALAVFFRKDSIAHSAKDTTAAYGVLLEYLGNSDYKYLIVGGMRKWIEQNTPSQFLSLQHIKQFVDLENKLNLNLSKELWKTFYKKAIPTTTNHPIFNEVFHCVDDKELLLFVLRAVGNQNALGVAILEQLESLALAKKPLDVNECKDLIDKMPIESDFELRDEFCQRVFGRLYQDAKIIRIGALKSEGKPGANLFNPEKDLIDKAQSISDLVQTSVKKQAMQDSLNALKKSLLWLTFGECISKTALYDTACTCGELKLAGGNIVILDPKTGNILPWTPQTASSSLNCLYALYLSKEIQNPKVGIELKGQLLSREDLLKSVTFRGEAPLPRDEGKFFVDAFNSVIKDAEARKHIDDEFVCAELSNLNDFTGLETDQLVQFAERGIKNALAMSEIPKLVKYLGSDGRKKILVHYIGTPATQDLATLATNLFGNSSMQELKDLAGAVPPPSPVIKIAYTACLLNNLKKRPISQELDLLITEGLKWFDLGANNINRNSFYKNFSSNTEILQSLSYDAYTEMVKFFTGQRHDLCTKHAKLLPELEAGSLAYKNIKTYLQAIAQRIIKKENFVPPPVQHQYSFQQPENRENSRFSLDESIVKEILQKLNSRDKELEEALIRLLPTTKRADFVASLLATPCDIRRGKEIWFDYCSSVGTLDREIHAIIKAKNAELAKWVWDNKKEYLSAVSEDVLLHIFLLQAGAQLPSVIEDIQANDALGVKAAQLLTVSGNAAIDSVVAQELLSKSYVVANLSQKGVEALLGRLVLGNGMDKKLRYLGQESSLDAETKAKGYDVIVKTPALMQALKTCSDLEALVALKVPEFTFEKYLSVLTEHLKVGAETDHETLDNGDSLLKLLEGITMQPPAGTLLSKLTKEAIGRIKAGKLTSGSDVAFCQVVILSGKVSLDNQDLLAVPATQLSTLEQSYYSGQHTAMESKNIARAMLLSPKILDFDVEKTQQLLTTSFPEHPADWLSFYEAQLKHQLEHQGESGLEQYIAKPENVIKFVTYLFSSNTEQINGVSYERKTIDRLSSTVEDRLAKFLQVHCDVNFWRVNHTKGCLLTKCCEKWSEKFNKEFLKQLMLSKGEVGPLTQVQQVAKVQITSCMLTESLTTPLEFTQYCQDIISHVDSAKKEDVLKHLANEAGTLFTLDDKKNLVKVLARKKGDKSLQALDVTTQNSLKVFMAPLAISRDQQQMTGSNLDPWVCLCLHLVEPKKHENVETLLPPGQQNAEPLKQQDKKEEVAAENKAKYNLVTEILRSNIHGITDDVGRRKSLEEVRSKLIKAGAAPWYVSIPFIGKYLGMAKHDIDDSVKSIIDDAVKQKQQKAEEDKSVVGGAQPQQVVGSTYGSVASKLPSLPGDTPVVPSVPTTAQTSAARSPSPPPSPRHRPPRRVVLIT